jgi:hypothetical protein
VQDILGEFMTSTFCGIQPCSFTRFPTTEHDLGGTTRLSTSAIVALIAIGNA